MRVTCVLSSAGLLVWVLSGCGPGSRAGRDDAAAPKTPSGDSIVTAEDIERTPPQSIEELLTSRFPGIMVTRSADGGIAIRIRGTTSVHGRTEPLFVIDGVPIEPGPGGSLFGINPHDIESIQVLTDAASTTMYGMRGANGIIVIKTKVPERPDSSGETPARALRRSER